MRISLSRNLIVWACLYAGVGPFVAIPAHAGYATFKEATLAASQKQGAGNYAGSRADCNAALALAANDQERASAINYIARNYYLEKKYEEARTAFKRTANLTGLNTGDRIDALIHVVNMYSMEAAHQRDKAAHAEMAEFARREYAKIIAMPEATETNRIDAQMGIGTSFWNESRLDESRDAYRKVVTMPGTTPVNRGANQNKVARTYFLQKQYDQCRKEYRVTLAMTDAPDYLRESAQFGIAESFDKEKQWETAIVEYRKAIAMGPFHVFELHDSQLGVANAFFELRNDAAATLEYQTLLSMVGVPDVKRRRAERQLKAIRERAG